MHTCFQQAVLVERDNVPAIAVTSRLHEIKRRLKSKEFARVLAILYAVTLCENCLLSLSSATAAPRLSVSPVLQHFAPYQKHLVNHLYGRLQKTAQWTCIAHGATASQIRLSVLNTNESQFPSKLKFTEVNE